MKLKAKIYLTEVGTSLLIYAVIMVAIFYLVRRHDVQQSQQQLKLLIEQTADNFQSQLDRDLAIASTLAESFSGMLIGLDTLPVKAY